MATVSASTATRDARKRNGIDENHPLTDKAQAALHSGVDKLANSASTAEQKIRQGAQYSAEAMAEKQEQIKGAWRQSEVRRFAKRNPLATAGIAFTAGALLASLLRGRN